MGGGSTVTGLGPQGPKRFEVGPGQLGPSAAAWAASPCVAALHRLELQAWDHVVVVAPHPDDEVLGAGGLVQEVAARGAAVEVLAVTDGDAAHGPGGPADRAALGRRRSDEALIALTRLGIAGVRRHRLAIPDGEVGGARRRLATALATRLGAGSLCVAPWAGDGHPDHQAVGEVAVDVAATVGASLLGYLVWAWHWADPAGGDVPWSACRRLDLTPRQRARKRWATGAFASQTRVPVAAAGGLAVLPPPVLRRFWQPWEVFVT